jgi:hypothetical protein
MALEQLFGAFGITMDDLHANRGGRLGPSVSVAPAVNVVVGMEPLGADGVPLQ